MADILSIGANAAQLYKSALATVGNNIANLNTDGYTRQVANSIENTPTAKGSSYIGSGARLVSVTRAFNEFTESNLRDSGSELSAQDPMIQYADRIVDVLGAQNSGLADAFSKFFSSASNLSSDPASTTLRNVFIRDADGLAVRFRELASQLSGIQQETDDALSLQLTSFNELGKQLFSVNEQLKKRAKVDVQPPSLLDQRDRIMREMSKIAKIHVTESESGTVSIRLDNAGGTLFVDALNVATLSANFDTDIQGGVEILADFNGAVGTTSSVTGGELGGILNFRSQILSPAIENLDALAVSTATEINAIQTNGIDATGTRGTNLFDPNVDTLGASGFSLLITEASKIAAAGLARVTANTENTGNAKLDYSDIVSGSAVPDFTLNYSDAAGYTINGAAVTPDASGSFIFGGITFKVSGTPADGDSFSVSQNTNAVGDNKSILAMSRLQNKQVLEGNRSLGDGYLDLVSDIGNASALAKISQEALQVVHDQAVAEKDKVSGVSLDQEAADLIRFQQAFQASAQVIQASNKMFDSLISIR